MQALGSQWIAIHLENEAITEGGVVDADDDRDLSDAEQLGFINGSRLLSKTRNCTVYISDEAQVLFISCAFVVNYERIWL